MMYGEKALSAHRTIELGRCRKSNAKYEESPNRVIAFFHFATVSKHRQPLVKLRTEFDNEIAFDKKRAS